MKKIFCIIFGCLLLITGKVNSFGYFQADSVHLIFDEPYNNALPRNFRMCSGEFIRPHKELPDTTGLGSLNISGSSEFSDKNLNLIIKTVNRAQITVIDLRQETHGFLNGMPISWYGKYDWADVALSRNEILNLEKYNLDSIKNSQSVTVTFRIKKDKSTDTFISFEDSLITVYSVKTEEELTKEFNTGYFRLTIADHRKPLTGDVDRFVNIIQNLKTDNWIHFHCHAGDGRTTTFMVMYDMLKNAKRVSFEDIISRQYLLGGIDLTKDEDFPSWDKQYAIERTEFLKSFYSYCRENTDNFKTSYSEYLNK